MKILVLSSRSPFELFMLVACILSGITGMFDPVGVSPAAARVLAPWLLYGWYGGLTLGGTIALYGLLCKTLVSLAVERVGLIVLAAMSTLYATSILVGDPITLAFAASFVVSFGFACVWRVRQIAQELRRVQEVVDSE